MKVFAAVNPEDGIRLCSSSGGVFTLLSHYVMGLGGVVCGAVFDKDFHVEHRIVDSCEALALLRGSKYVYGRSAHIFATVKRYLDDGREVLFSGCPCQVAALKKFIGADYQNLFTVDIVCHGAPKGIYWELYLQAYCHKHGFSAGDIESVNFRDKTAGGGWRDYNFTIRLKNGREFTEPYRENGYMKMFLFNYTLRDACFRCVFKGAASKADMTIGDFWGIEQLRPDVDDNKGVSLLIPHTIKGKEYCSRLPIVAEFNLEYVLPFNPHITANAGKPADIDAFRAECSATGIWPDAMAGSLSFGRPVQKESRSFFKRLFKRWR